MSATEIHHEMVSATKVSFDFGEVPPAKAELPPLEPDGLASPVKSRDPDDPWADEMTLPEWVKKERCPVSGYWMTKVRAALTAIAALRVPLTAWRAAARCGASLSGACG